VQVDNGEVFLDADELASRAPHAEFATP
jgi:hypothetical protein